MKLSTTVTYDADSVWFRGHFPGNPVLPGIAQLKAVADLVTSSSERDLSLTGMSRIKFKKLVKPAEQLDICVTYEKEKDHFMFQITCDSEDVCSGKMLFTQIKK